MSVSIRPLDRKSYKHRFVGFVPGAVNRQQQVIQEKQSRRYEGAVTKKKKPKGVFFISMCKTTALASAKIVTREYSGVAKSTEE